MNAAFLCLGGNIGDRLANLMEAKRQISVLGCEVVDESGIYKTKAWGNTEAPDYYNQVVHIKTTLKAQELMNILLRTEQNMGRLRTDDRNASRTMDIDILFFNNETIKTNELEVPHPRLHLRNFVLVPLCEIAPTFLHPQCNKTIQQLLQACSDKSYVIKI